jgi:iron-sulfur cluster assembly protein
MKTLPPPITLTDAAAERIKSLLATATDDVLGVRLGVKTAGCSGYGYNVEFAKAQKPMEQVVEHKGAKVFVDPAATMFLLGTELDYEETKMRSGFVFNNPNETARCGCGESFAVKEQ